MVKVLLVKEDVKEFEKYLSEGWKLAHGTQHPEGVLIVLVKQAVASVDPVKST
jgi:hypothetical protein